ncbi:hypothetical protein SY88_07970 [Clostridiales bacterium PH28_bin88]|nr:hypothetical protein SY88_07970 [Clostridiales bacterium PH28_bin88]
MPWNTIRLMALISYLLGAAVVLGGLRQYLTSDSKIGLYVALAIIVVGPVEDLLNMIISGGEISEEERRYYMALVNHLTSIGFLVLLGLILRENRL